MMVERGSKWIMSEMTQRGDLLKGVLLPIAPPVAVIASPLSGRLKIVAFGAWGIYLFLLRDLIVPASVRVAYRKRWTKIFLFPYSAGEPESAIRSLRALCWGYLAI